MARAQEVAGHWASSDPQSWLAEVLRTRFDEVLSYREPALDNSAVQPVHDMRVAIRRLRSVIRDFAELAEKTPLKEIRSDLKQLADALGTVRDADVAVKALEKFKEKAKKTRVRDGIETIIAQFRERRISGFEDLVPHLSTDAITKLEEHFQKGLEKSLEHRSLFTSTNLEEAIHEIISNRVDDFIKLSDAVYDPFRQRRIHKLRIAGKHLRYAVELFSLYVESNVDGFAEAIADMQKHLGDVHDCDVWIEKLQASLTAKKGKAIKGHERDASLWLLSQYVRKRNKAYRSALRLWNKWERADLLDRLKEWKPVSPELDTKNPRLRLVAN